MANPKRLSDGTSDPNAVNRITFETSKALKFYSSLLVGIEYISYETPAPFQHAPRVEDLLRKFQVPIHGAYFVIREAQATPVLNTTRREDYIPLQLSGYQAELRGSPKEKVVQARKVMIELLIHELDEWLFEAGLADDPHACWNEQNSAELNHIYERGTAQL